LILFPACKFRPPWKLGFVYIILYVAFLTTTVVVETTSSDDSI
jgi:hypothetical protein